LIQPTRTTRPMTLFVGAGIILATIACQLQLGGPSAPEVPAIDPPDSAQALDQAWDSALEAAEQSGEVQFIVNESQLNAFLGQRLEAGAAPFLIQPEVYLRQGQIQIYGVTTQAGVEARVHLAIVPILDSDGRLGFEVASAEFGPLPAPDALKEAISKVLSEALTGTFASFATGVQVTSIAISDGQMAIVGKLR